MLVFTSPASGGWGGVESVVLLILSVTQHRGGEGNAKCTHTRCCCLNLIDSRFKLTGEINCRMKHKQKAAKKRTNEQITTAD